MIPDEAVEAAAYALFLDANPDSEVQWYDITFHDQDQLMRPARAALEAAAAHMLNPAPAIMEGPSEGADAVTGFPRAAYRKRRMG